MGEFQFDQERIEFIKKSFSNKFKFRLVMRKVLPMGYLSKMYVSELTEEKCSVSVPYNNRNKNPFKSTFWAVQAMAAEMSSGALLTMYTHKQPASVAMLVLGMEANFEKKATDITTFVCEDGLKIRQAIKQTIETKEAQLIKCSMTGRNLAGEVVSNFTFTWSVKARSRK